MNKQAMVVRTALKGQARGFRYRGQADMDVTTPWYWLPMEAPNYTQLPEKYDLYMAQGFGQEQVRVSYNPGASGEHERMGRKYTTLLQCGGCFLLAIGYLWYMGKLAKTFRTDEDHFNNVRLSDFRKYPFDNLYEYTAGAVLNDPAYYKHINSKGTY
eukprot:TRINITY_DN1064_c1_g2_i1.p1 TRINITY_DN1064_c1_g2~~TRINITY_DN1064_c1_g2_i1.p1  ORF type:complete len:157 (+),score=41.25 TRINITY_DN1064_c1_g2_i1:40-510(+)